MPKFKVYAPLVATKYLGEFEGDTAEDAILAALNSSESAPVGLCHGCANEVGDSHLEVDEDKAFAEPSDA